MRFVSYNYIDRFARAGVLLGDAVIDLSAAAPLVFDNQDGTRWELLDFLRGAPEGMGLEGAAERLRQASLAAEGAKLEGLLALWRPALDQ